MRSLPFQSVYAHGFVRVAVGIPTLRVADPAFNLARTIDVAHRASVDYAAVVLFPELGLSGYSNEDLFHQDALLEATRDAILRAHRSEPLDRAGDRRRRAAPSAGRAV